MLLQKLKKYSCRLKNWPCHFQRRCDCKRISVPKSPLPISPKAILLEVVFYTTDCLRTNWAKIRDSNCNKNGKDFTTLLLRTFLEQTRKTDIKWQSKNCDQLPNFHSHVKISTELVLRKYLKLHGLNIVPPITIKRKIHQTLLDILPFCRQIIRKNCHQELPGPVYCNSKRKVTVLTRTDPINVNRLVKLIED